MAHRGCVRFALGADRILPIIYTLWQVVTNAQSSTLLLDGSASEEEEYYLLSSSIISDVKYYMGPSEQEGQTVD